MCEYKEKHEILPSDMQILTNSRIPIKNFNVRFYSKGTTSNTNQLSLIPMRKVLVLEAGRYEIGTFLADC